MVAPNNPLIARVAMVFNRDTRTWVNTFHVAKSTAWTASDLAQLAVTFDSWDSAIYSTCRPTGVTLVQIQCRKYDPSDPLAYDFSVQPPRPGTRIGFVNPGNATTTMSWRTGLAGRKYRGRDYVPGLAEGDVSDLDQISSPLITQLAAAAGQLLLNLAGVNFNLAIFHRATDLFTTVTSFIIEQIVDSQRRRLPGRGR